MDLVVSCQIYPHRTLPGLVDAGKAQAVGAARKVHSWQSRSMKTRRGRVSSRRFKAAPECLRNRSGYGPAIVIGVGPYEIELCYLLKHLHSEGSFGDAAWTRVAAASTTLGWTSRRRDPVQIRSFAPGIFGSGPEAAHARAAQLPEKLRMSQRPLVWPCAFCEEEGVLFPYLRGRPNSA
jgi:hypothetical protein